MCQKLKNNGSFENCRSRAFQNWSSNLAIVLFRLVEFHLKTARHFFLQKCKSDRLIVSSAVLLNAVVYFCFWSTFDTNQGELMCKQQNVQYNDIVKTFSEMVLDHTKVLYDFSLSRGDATSNQAVQSRGISKSGM